MPRKAVGRRDNDLGGLMERLEAMQEELDPNKSQEPEEETDSFSKLRKLAARQVNEIRYVVLIGDFVSQRGRRCKSAGAQLV